MTGGRLLLTTLTLTTLLTLPACTPNKPIPPPPTPTASPPTPTATAPPEPTTEHSAKGATAFVRYFWDLYNYAYASYDTAPIADRSDPSCRFCSSVIQQVEKLEAAHTRVEGYEARAGESAVPTTDVGDRALVVISVTQAAGTEIPVTGSPRPLPTSPPTRFSFGLRWDGDTWKIHGVDFEPAK